jgi:flagellar biogenesis protein FliO
MPTALEVALLTAGPFVAIGLVARVSRFRPLTVALAAIAGELFGILVLVLVNQLLVSRVLSGKADGMVVFFPPSSEDNSLSTLAFIIAYALVVAAIFLFGRWVYVRTRPESSS